MSAYPIRYHGDQTHLVGTVCGPGLDDLLSVVISAEYDETTDSTTAYFKHLGDSDD